MGEQAVKRLITVFGEAMSRIASRTSRVTQAKGDDTKADGAMKNPISATKRTQITIRWFEFFLFLPLAKMVRDGI